MVIGRDPWLVIMVAIAIGVFGQPTTAAAQIATDGSVGEARTLTGPNYAIAEALGRRAGSNLFHSFQTFDIRTGESATFSGSADVSTIISRVTGGAGSTIDGRLASTVAGADFYFINPAGLLFGPNASLDIDGSFHAATADHLSFADGSRYSASDPASSSFTTAPPAAFGFLGSAPAALSVSGAALDVPAGQILAFAGGDIDMTDATLGGAAAQLAVTAHGTTTSAVGTGGTLRIQGGALTVTGTGDESLSLTAGVLEIDSARIGLTNLGTNATPSAGIALVADQLEVGGGASITTTAFGSGAIGPVAIKASVIDIADGAQVQTQTFGIAQSSAITIDTATLNVRNGAIIRTDSFGGPSGDITVRASESAALSTDANPLGAPSEIRAIARSTAPSGDVLLVTPRLVIDQALVGTATTFTGAPGNTTITADSVTITGGTISANAQGFVANTSGTIRIDTMELRSDASAFFLSIIDASHRAFGNAGEIALNADEMTIQNTLLRAGAFSGNGGAIRLTGGQIQLGGQFALLSNVFGGGNAGTISITAGQALTMLGIGSTQSRLVADATTFIGVPGDGGTIQLKAPRVTIDHVRLSSTGGFGANSGDITIEGNEIALGPGTILATEGFGLTGQDAGAAGAIRLTGTKSITITGEATDATIIGSSAEDAGTAGTIAFQAPDIVIDNTIITNEIAGTARAGQLTLQGDRIRLQNRASINSDTLGENDGGDVEVKASESIVIRNSRVSSSSDDVLVDAGDPIGNGGTVLIDAPTVTLDNGRVTTTTDGLGNAGQVRVVATDLSVVNNGTIASQSRSGGDAGDVNVTVVQSIRLVDLGTISASAFPLLSSDPADGNAGIVTVNAGSLEMDRGRVTSSAVDGNGGSVSITSPTITMTGDSLINASSTGRGTAGDIVIMAAALTLGEHAEILADVVADGRGGTVSIWTDTLTLSGDAEIASDVDEGASGIGGSVAVQVATLRLLGSSEISSETAGSGAGGAVVISATADLEVSDEAGIVAAAEQDGDAGSITINAGRLTMTAGMITAETNGEGDGGSIGIAARTVDLKEGARIATTSTGNGDAGAIAITSNQFALATGATIEASSTGGGEAGGITINAGKRFVAGGGRVATSTTQSDGGNITIRAVELVALNDADITTSVQGGAGSGGNIDVDPTFIVLVDSRIIANAVAGNGGNITLVAGTLFVDDTSVISASSELGIDGAIVIDAPDSDVEGSLALLNGEFLDAAAKLSQQCSVRAGTSSATLVAGGRGALPDGPEHFLNMALFIAPGSGERTGARPTDGRKQSALPTYIPTLAKLTCHG